MPPHASRFGRDLGEVPSGERDFARTASYLENQPNSDTNGGHGTHVASIAAGSGPASGGLFVLPAMVKAIVTMFGK